MTDEKTMAILVKRQQCAKQSADLWRARGAKIAEYKAGAANALLSAIRLIDKINQNQT